MGPTDSTPALKIATINVTALARDRLQTLLQALRQTDSHLALLQETRHDRLRPRWAFTLARAR
eukprot:7485785-Pyramimonas_sp.AAC.1